MRLGHLTQHVVGLVQRTLRRLLGELFGLLVEGSFGPPVRAVVGLARNEDLHRLRPGVGESFDGLRFEVDEVIFRDRRVNALKLVYPVNIRQERFFCGVSR